MISNLKKVTGVQSYLWSLSGWKYIVTLKGDTYKFNSALVSQLREASTDAGILTQFFQGNIIARDCLFLHGVDVYV